MKPDRRGRINDILAFVEKHGIERKDVAAAGGTLSRDGGKRGGHSHRMTLDLHGLRSDDATRKLRYALDRCSETGMRELLVIHGYGLHSDPNEGPVLKKLVRDLLENDLRPKYRSYRSAGMRDGGDGATIILLR